MQGGAASAPQDCDSCGASGASRVGYGGGVYCADIAECNERFYAQRQGNAAMIDAALIKAAMSYVADKEAD